MTTWRNLSRLVKVVLVIVALLAIWAVVGRIELSHGGKAGPATDAPGLVHVRVTR